MRGMSRKNGKSLHGIEHLKQSIVDILSTPIGSRVMRREYGSDLFNLIDKPVNKSLFPQIYAAVADALDKWEPRFKLEKIEIYAITSGHITINLEGIYLLTQSKIIITGVTI